MVIISVIKTKGLLARERLVLALDVDDFESAKNFVDKLKDYVGVFKIGSQLFTSEGIKVIDMIKQSGSRQYFRGIDKNIHIIDLQGGPREIVTTQVDEINGELEGNILCGIALVIRRREEEDPVIGVFRIR